MVKAQATCIISDRSMMFESTCDGVMMKDMMTISTISTS